MSYAMFPVGQAPEPKRLDARAIAGWAALVATAAGIFYLTTSGKGVQANRRRRTSKRPRRRVSRNASRKRRKRKDPSWRVRSSERTIDGKVFGIGPDGPYFVVPPGIGYVNTPAALAMAKKLGVKKNRRVSRNATRRRRRYSAERDREIKALAGLKLSKDPMYGELVKLLRKKYGTAEVTRMEVAATEQIVRLERRRVSRNATKKRTTRKRNVKRRTSRSSKLPEWMNKVIYWGKHGRDAYYVTAPNLNVRLYRGTDAKARALEVAQGLAKRYKLPLKRVNRNVRRNTSRAPLRSYKALSPAARKRMPESSFALSGKRFPIKGPPGSSRERDKWQAMQAIRYLHMGRVKNRSEYLAVRNAIIRKYGQGFWRSYDGPSWDKVERAQRKRRKSRRRTSRLAANVRGTERKTTAKGRASYALSQVRRAGRATTPKAGKLNRYVRARLARMEPGTYRVGGAGRDPAIAKFKSKSLQGQMTSTRIAASKSKEPHWLVKVYREGYPKVVVIRKINAKGQTVYRVEEYAAKQRAKTRARKTG